MNQQIQQNLNQIVSMCNQLSQSEQTNVSKLSQLLEAERTAAQQLQHCAQLCQQVSQQISQQINQQMQQMSNQQYGNLTAGQQHFAATAPGSMGAQSNIATNSWANRPINTSNFSAGSPYGSSQYGGSQFVGSISHYGSGRFETARELTPSPSVFNTNKDLNS